MWPLGSKKTDLENQKTVTKKLVDSTSRFCIEKITYHFFFIQIPASISLQVRPFFYLTDFLYQILHNCLSFCATANPSKRSSMDYSPPKIYAKKIECAELPFTGPPTSSRIFSNPALNPQPQTSSMLPITMKISHPPFTAPPFQENGELMSTCPL